MPVASFNSPKGHERVIVIHLMGGLGNQMFQYAAGRQIAHRLRTTLKLDISAYATDELRTYSLSPFNIQEQFATLEELVAIRRPDTDRLLRYSQRLSRMLKLPFGWTIIQENHIRPFDPRLSKVFGNVYMKGYWQSEKYFAAIQDIIRHEFTVKGKPNTRNRSLAEMIGEVESVSIHVRRGDYIGNSQTNQFHGVTSLIYYQSSVAYITAKMSQPHFFVFSDDPDWCQANLQLSYPTTYVTVNDVANPHEDLRLMSLCKHNIIANSTFSWWGAWLNTNPAKIVCAPRHWFSDPKMDTQDLLPLGWIQL